MKMAGLNYIKLVVMGVQKGACPCCIGGDVARVLGSTADCLCERFVGQLKKHAQKGLPAYHTCLRDITGRGRLFVYMLQKDILHVELMLFGFPTHREMVGIDEKLRGLGSTILSTYADYGYTPEELARPAEEAYAGPPLEKQGLVALEERLAQALAEGPPWEREPDAVRDERPPRPVPPSLVGHQ